MPNRHTCLFSLVVLCLGSVRCEELFAQRGNTAKLPCGGAVKWMYNSDVICKDMNGIMSKGSAPMKERAKMKGDRLEISKVEDADAGTYTCERGNAGRIVHQLYVFSVSSSPASLLLQGTQVDLRCQVSGGSKIKPMWFRPNGTLVTTSEAGLFTLQSVDVADGGNWNCQIKPELKINLPITVLGLRTTPALTARPGESVLLPCVPSQNLSGRSVDSLRLQEGGWKRLSPGPARLLSLGKNADGKLVWNSTGTQGNSLLFTQEKLGANLSVTLKQVTVQHSGEYQCFLTFTDKGTVTAQVSLKVKGQRSKTDDGPGTNGGNSNGLLSQAFLGLSLWVWLAIGVGCLVLVVLIVITVCLHQRNKRIKRRARKLRSMRQPLTAKDYCQCNRSAIGRPNGRRRGDAASVKECQR